MSNAEHAAETLEERLERYGRMVASTRQLAARTDKAEIRTAYLELAAKWVHLAGQAARGPPRLVAAPTPSPSVQSRRVKEGAAS